MKKLTLLTVTALTLICVGGQALTAQAAGNRNIIISKGTPSTNTYKSGCNMEDILSNLANCFPETSFPSFNFPSGNGQVIIIPGTNCPDTEWPDYEMPDTNTPDTDYPDFEVPDTNAPDTDYPDFEMPDSNVPDFETPDINFPENNRPENTPGNDSTEEIVPDDNTTNEHAFIQQVVDLVNEERAKEGLSPLTVDTKVQAAAMVRAKECEQYFSHTRPNGSTFATALKEQNVSYRSAGENIAYGQRTPEEVMKAWMNSSGHRANIMNPNFTTIGVGYYENANGTDYWCQLFTR